MVNVWYLVPGPVPGTWYLVPVPDALYRYHIPGTRYLESAQTESTGKPTVLSWGYWISNSSAFGVLIWDPPRLGLRTRWPWVGSSLYNTCTGPYVGPEDGAGVGGRVEGKLNKPLSSLRSKKFSDIVFIPLSHTAHNVTVLSSKT